MLRPWAEGGALRKAGVTECVSSLRRDGAEGADVCWADVAYDPDDDAVRLRREMEAAFGPGAKIAEGER